MGLEKFLVLKNVGSENFWSKQIFFVNIATIIFYVTNVRSHAKTVRILSPVYYVTVAKLGHILNVANSM